MRKTSLIKNKEKDTEKKNVLLLYGIQEELFTLINQKHFDFYYNSHYKAYHSRTLTQLFAMSVGAGLKKKKEVIRLLEEIKPRHIINAGLVGSLYHKKKDKSSQIGEEAEITLLKMSRELIQKKFQIKN